MIALTVSGYIISGIMFIAAPWLLLCWPGSSR